MVSRYVMEGEVMDRTEHRKIAGNNVREICHLSQMQVFATSYYQKNYFQRQIDHRIEELLQMVGREEPDSPEAFSLEAAVQEEPAIREFTREELAAYNGEDGRPVYVAVNNNVYDLSAARPWEGGRHNGLEAGQDLSDWFISCHMGITSVLEKYPLVGVLKEGPDTGAEE